jgi:hypothetical protein
MDQIEFPRDFKEFLRLLHDHEVDYLLVGGFAVALHEPSFMISRARTFG